MRIADEWPVDLISVDSAQVYRGMDIGSAKPDTDTLKKYPHALIDIRDPEDSYSAGDFVRDAEREIDESHARARVPLLVGGTMMYFRSLTEGIAELPDADETVRRAIDREADRAGWPAMHDELQRVDPLAAARIEPNDKQRIQRALEVYRTSGRTISAWQADTKPVRDDYRFEKIAVIPVPRRRCTNGSLQGYRTCWKPGSLMKSRDCGSVPACIAPALRCDPSATALFGHISMARSPWQRPGSRL